MQFDDADEASKEDEEVIEENDVEMNEFRESGQEEFYLELEEEEEEDEEEEDKITSNDETKDEAEAKEIMELQVWAIENNIPHTPF